MTNPKLALIPSGYNTATVYSILPNNTDGDFAYERNGSATRVRKDGLIEEVVDDTPRLDWLNSDCPSLLLEPQRTNIQAYSENFSGAAWTPSLVTITANSSICPNGELTAYKLETTSSVGSLNGFLQITANTEYTYSLFVKADTTSICKIELYDTISSSRYFYGTVIFDMATETISTSLATASFDKLDGGWYRLKMTATSPNPLLGSTGVQISLTQAGSIFIWGAQMEAGGYATSYIKNVDDINGVTRLVDSCEVASGLENVINQTEGVFYIEFEYLYETTTDSSTDANRDILVLGTASDISEGISIDNFRSQFRVFIQGSGMTTQSVGASTTGSSQPNTRYKLAVNYKSGDNKAYLNGSLLGSVQTGDVNFATDLDGIFFSYNSGSRPFKNQKKVYDLRVYDTALTDAELTELTTI